MLRLSFSRIGPQALGLIFLAAIPALLTPLWRPEFRARWQRPAVPEVTVEQISQWKKPLLWVDARKRELYAKQHIAGAVELHEDAWEELLPLFLDVWRPGTHVVVYCDSEACNASQAVALRLKRELDLVEVYTLRGGWREWQKTHP